MIAPQATHTLVIDQWHPARLNAFLGRHWSHGRKLKAHDAAVIRLEGQRQRIPRAFGRRRVSLILEGWSRGRLPDPDAFWKSLLDGLVHAGLLVDDSGSCCDLGSVTLLRRPQQRTTIVLEDLA